MIVFVTGGSGFVGGHAIEGLVAAGHEVRALARTDGAVAKVSELGASAVRGDLHAMARETVAGCDVIVHAAARAEDWGSREDFWEANVIGTERALAAARAASVKRFIHIGTEAAFFVGRDLVGIDESAPYPERHRYLYSETKAEAEQRVLADNRRGLETISLRPRFVWGPRDATVLPNVLAMAKVGRFAWIDDGRQMTSTTHVANLVHAIVLALDHGVPGHSYFVADDGTRSIRAFLTAYARTAGVELPAKSIPRPIARAAARLIESGFRLVGAKGRPPMSRFAIDMLSSSVTVETGRARRELGWAPIIDVESGLRALADQSSQNV